MSKGQRKRRVGVGMKPRGIQGGIVQKAVIGVDTSSTTEGQPETVIVPVSEAQEREERGPTLEPEIDSRGESQKEPHVAEITNETADLDLQKALEMSSKVDSEVIDAEFEEVATEPSPHIPTIAEMEQAINDGRVVRIDASGTVDIGDKPGPRPDGSYGIVVSIGEGYWDAVQQWAEADDLKPSEWLNMRIAEFLDTWSYPAKGR